MDLDVQKIMLQLLETQKKYVREDRESYAEAMVAIFTNDNRSYLQFPAFDTEAEKIAEYGAIVQRAIDESAALIITVNHARSARSNALESLDGADWGTLDETNSDPCILLTASGASVASASLQMIYKLTANDVLLGPPEFLTNVELNLLPDWPPAGSARPNPN